MTWLYKALIQKFISFLPYSHRINYLLQRYLTVGKELHHSFVIDKLNHAQKHIKSFAEFGNTSLEKAKILEIGTGWYPIVPIVFYLSGSNNIETTDIRKLYCKKSIDQALRSIIKLFNENSIRELIPKYQEDRIETLKLALNQKRIHSKFDLLKIKSTIYKSSDYAISSKSKDFIVSNNTIQYIKKTDMIPLFSELARIGESGSVLSLAIDFTDEFSHFDRSISNFNFLKFSERKWKRITWRSYSVNRLRYTDIKKHIVNHFHLRSEEIINGKTQELEEVSIHKQFSQYNTEELLVKHVHIVAENY